MFKFKRPSLYLMLDCMSSVVRCILAVWWGEWFGARGCAPRPRVDNPAELQRPRAKPARLGNTAVNTSPLSISQAVQKSTRTYPSYPLTEMIPLGWILSFVSSITMTLICISVHECVYLLQSTGIYQQQQRNIRFPMLQVTMFGQRSGSCIINELLNTDRKAKDGFGF